MYVSVCECVESDVNVGLSKGLQTHNVKLPLGRY